MADEREKFLKKLRGLGEEEVRAKQKTNHFGLTDSKRNNWAKEWLREKEKENDVAKSPVVKSKEKTSQTAEDISTPVSSKTKNKNIVKTALLIGSISLIIFIVTLCSGPPG